MKIIENISHDKAEELREKIRQNNGYCLCAIIHDDSTKCMCHDFIENISEGPCHCGLYKKEK